MNVLAVFSSNEDAASFLKIELLSSHHSDLIFRVTNYSILSKELGELEGHNYHVSTMTIADLLKKHGYSLQANQKRHEAGADHPNRDEQFQYINQRVQEVQEADNPVVSADIKKKELIGNYKNNGEEYQKKGKPVVVNAYDFPDKEKGKAIPYDVYDIRKNEGWVNAGTDHDTGEFAVESIRQWWYRMGSITYPNAREILITADGGGSNSSRSRLWKVELQQLSDEINIPISVCHFPQGTSKWNKIEHRLLSKISMNWRAAHCLIGSTTTKTGLQIGCELDENPYELGKKVTDEVMK